MRTAAFCFLIAVSLGALLINDVYLQGGDRYWLYWVVFTGTGLLSSFHLGRSTGA